MSRTCKLSGEGTCKIHKFGLCEIDQTDESSSDHSDDDSVKEVPKANSKTKSQKYVPGTLVQEQQKKLQKKRKKENEKKKRENKKRKKQENEKNRKTQNKDENKDSLRVRVPRPKKKSKEEVVKGEPQSTQHPPDYREIPEFRLVDTQRDSQRYYYPLKFLHKCCYWLSTSDCPWIAVDPQLLDKASKVFKVALEDTSCTLIKVDGHTEDVIRCALRLAELASLGETKEMTLDGLSLEQKIRIYEFSNQYDFPAVNKYLKDNLSPTKTTSPSDLIRLFNSKIPQDMIDLCQTWIISLKKEIGKQLADELSMTPDQERIFNVLISGKNGPDVHDDETWAADFKAIQKFEADTRSWAEVVQSNLLKTLPSGKTWKEFGLLTFEKASVQASGQAVQASGQAVQASGQAVQASGQAVQAVQASGQASVQAKHELRLWVLKSLLKWSDEKLMELFTS